MCYTNILQILDLSQIPFRAAERTWECPIVIGGGPCSYNPEPIAEFFDIFYIGEERHSIVHFWICIKCRESGVSREAFLVEAAKLPGMYVPQFYEVTYHENGTIKSFEPTRSDIPRTILKEIVTDVSNTYYPEKPVVPFIKCTQDRVVLEIQRGVFVDAVFVRQDNYIVLCGSVMWKCSRNMR